MASNKGAITGNIGITDSIGNVTVQESGMPRRAPQSTSASPLASTIVGALGEGVKLIPTIMKAQKTATLNSMIAELDEATKGWVAKGMKTTLRRTEREKFRKKWEEQGHSYELINQAYAARPATKTVDREIGGRTMLFDPNTKSRLDRAPALKAVDRVTSNIMDADNLMPKAMTAYSNDILPNIPQEENFQYFAPHMAKLFKNVSDTIEDSNVDNLFSNIINLEDYTDVKKANGAKIKNAIYEAASFLSSRPVAEMYGRTDNKMTIAAPGLAINGMFADIFQKFRENPDLHAATGITAENLSEMQKTLVSGANGLSEFFALGGSALGVQTSRLRLIKANNQFGQEIRDQNKLEILRTGNKYQQALYSLIQKGNIGALDALGGMAEIYTVLGDTNSLASFKLEMFNPQLSDMNEYRVDQLLESAKTKGNPQSAYLKVGNRVSLLNVLQGTIGVQNPEYESKIISFAQTYVEDLKNAAEQKNKAGEDGDYLNTEAENIKRSLDRYIDRTKRANKLIEKGLSNTK